MFAVPAAIPITGPTGFITATAVLPLLHSPPDTRLLKLVVLPAHTKCVPLIELGNSLIVITFVA